MGGVAMGGERDAAIEKNLGFRVAMRIANCYHCHLQIPIFFTASDLSPMYSRGPSFPSPYRRQNAVNIINNVNIAKINKYFIESVRKNIPARFIYKMIALRPKSNKFSTR